MSQNQPEIVTLEPTRIPQMISLPDTCKMLACSRHGVLCLEYKDPTFPRRIKLGTSRVSPVYFDLHELTAWIESKKERQA